MTIKRRFAVLFFVMGSVFLVPSPSYALFGADAAMMIPYLIQQLTEMYKQYAELQQMLSQGKANSDYLHMINAGMDNILGLMNTLPIQDERILADVRSLQYGTTRIDTLYGPVPRSGIAPMHTLHDQTISESIEMTNSARDYANHQEANANRAFQMANTMSPKGAERLGAATQAQILHTLTQIMKIDGQILKLQGEQFALANMGSKDSVGHFNQVNAGMTKTLGGFKGDLDIPKF